MGHIHKTMLDVLLLYWGHFPQYPIVRPLGQGISFLLWIQCLGYVLALYVI